jgi:hypothetical protein
MDSGGPLSRLAESDAIGFHSGLVRLVEEERFKSLAWRQPGLLGFTGAACGELPLGPPWLALSGSGLIGAVCATIQGQWDGNCTQSCW